LIFLRSDLCFLLCIRERAVDAVRNPILPQVKNLHSNRYFFRWIQTVHFFFVVYFGHRLVMRRLQTRQMLLWMQVRLLYCI
jgi:hypothetical protein